jgi:hypothetical protein
MILYYKPAARDQFIELTVHDLDEISHTTQIRLDRKMIWSSLKKYKNTIHRPNL